MALSLCTVRKQSVRIGTHEAKDRLLRVGVWRTDPLKDLPVSLPMESPMDLMSQTG